MPAEYIGREQTWLKHRVLTLYLQAWAHKLGSFTSHLWYVDCFAGPWESKDTARRDTSIAIGLSALNEAAETWRERFTIGLDAVFVEKDPKAYADLDSFLPEVKGGVHCHPVAGAFGEHVGTIDRMIGGDSAFVFVDPTGWDGAAMSFIGMLAKDRGRDVMINVMYDHINRFRYDERDFLRQQMREFFGLAEGELPPDLTEDQLMAFYRGRLRQVAQLPYVADLAIPVPTSERTKFRLVVGGHHPEVVRLFRDVEKRVIGAEAGVVRHAAKARKVEERNGQLGLLSSASAPPDRRYADQHASDERAIRAELPARLSRGPVKFGDLWPELLCEHHITYTELKQLVWAMQEAGTLAIEGVAAKERSVKDEHSVRLA